MSLRGRLDRLEAVRRAKRAGLPDPIAERIGQIVADAELPEPRREEVLRELVAHFEDGLSSGKTPAALLAAFGDGGRVGMMIGAAKRVVTPESAGGTGGGGWLDGLGRDLRYAVRRLAARPAFTATAVLSLALGIGANSAMFTLVNEVILRKPRFERPDELVDLYQKTREFEFGVFSEPDLVDLRKGTTAFAGFAATQMSLVPYEAAGRIERLTAELVSGDYFATLGMVPFRGRLIAPADAPAPGAGAVVVLGHRAWRRLFGADPAIVGRSIRLSGTSYQVIGIAPPDYPGRLLAVPTDVFVPVTMIDRLEPSSTSQLEDRGNTGTIVTARLGPGVTAERARVEVARVADELRRQGHFNWQADASITVIPRNEVIILPPIDRILVPVAGMLMLVVGLVLVIACANLAGFLLARAVDRRKEIAVRLALGATRRRLIGQLLVETVLLALVGGGLGLALGRAALRVVLAADIPLPVPVDLSLTIDGRVLGFSILVSIGAGLFFGLMPALQATRLEIASVIRDETTGGGRRKAMLRHLLVGGQVAVSLVLLTVAGLFLRSLEVARRVDPGFGDAPAALAWVALPDEPRPTPGPDRLARLTRAIAEVPGVERVGAITHIHLNALGTSSDEVEVPGIEPPAGRTSHTIDRTAIDSGLVEAIGLTLVAGRNLAAADADSGRRVALVNEAFAERFFPGRPAVGQRYRNGGAEVEVVGVVKTAKIRNLGEPPRPAIYTPLGPRATALWLVARTGGDADRLLPAIQQAIAAVDPAIYPIQLTTVARHVAALSYPLEIGAAALMGFAALALALAAIGLYGAVSYAVARRSREVGIRLSLGASRADVIRLLLGGGLRLIAGGVVAGVIGALAIGRLVEGLLFGVRGFDPITLGAVIGILAAVALVAAWVPARRAGRIDPVVALKAE